jgi:hypothetical protein
MKAEEFLTEPTLALKTHSFLRETRSGIEKTRASAVGAPNFLAPSFRRTLRIFARIRTHLGMRIDE